MYTYSQLQPWGGRCHRMHTFAKKCAKSFFSWKLRLFILHCSYFRWRCSWPPRILLTKGMLRKIFKNTMYYDKNLETFTQTSPHINRISRQLINKLVPLYPSQRVLHSSEKKRHTPGHS